jgi:microcystin-dependent protein
MRTQNRFWQLVAVASIVFCLLGNSSPYMTNQAGAFASAPTRFNGVVPVGGIIQWSGSIGNIPPGWALCDGSNGTPDMRDKFIVGAGGKYAVGATGGAATVDASHTHGYGTIAIASNVHSHGVMGKTSSGAAHTLALESVAVQTGAGARVVQSVELFGAAAHSHSINFATAEDAHSHSISGSTATGGNVKEENLPPFYALAFIMRIS